MSRQQKMEKKILISKLHALGWSFRKIQQETGVHRETIAKYIKESLLEQEKPEKIGQAKDSEKSSSNSLCVPFDDFIKECILKNLSAQRIYQDLVRDHSFQGSYPCRDMLGAVPPNLKILTSEFTLCLEKKLKSISDKAPQRLSMEKFLSHGFSPWF